MKVTQQGSNYLHIEDGEKRSLISYGVTIVTVIGKSVYLDQKYWDYSATTRKHRCQFLKEDSKTVKSKISSGEYELCNLNNQYHKTMETLKNNQLIAKFMGQPTSDDDHTENRFDELWKYDSSWEWLMPVVEKIESIPVKWKISQFREDGWTKSKNPKDHWYEIQIQGQSCEIYEGMACVDLRQISLPHNDPYFKWTDVSKLFAVYTTVLEFIQWYNTQQL